MSTPHHPQEQQGLLNGTSPYPSTGPSTPLSARHHPGYTRVTSISFNESPLTRDITDSLQEANDHIDSAHDLSASRGHGLGISSVTNPVSPGRADRTGTATFTQTSLDDYRSPLGQIPSPYTPSMRSYPSGSTKFEETFDTPRGPRSKSSHFSLESGIAPSTYAKSDAGLLSIRSRYDDFAAAHNCASAKNVKHGRLSNWVSVTMMILVVFSTAFSAMYLVIAALAPQWGKAVRNSGGRLTPSTAAFLTSLFAKLIELSFVTVSVSFLGQALARRAFKQENARGVTLAEMSMRTWIMQPGTMLTNWESVRYAGVTMLGIISLLAAVVATLYTSAATALVQPQLKYPDWQPQTLQGLVKTQFANPTYRKAQCKTPISVIQDPLFESEDVRGTTCLQVQHAALAYHNYQTWLAGWTDVVNNGSGSTDIAQRPKGYALHNDNTTVQGPWISQQNVTVIDGNFVNNVTLAMPHVGVIQAVNDPINDLLQPGDIDGAIINIRASLPSPMVNVLCVTMNQTDLKPFVYDLWEGYPKLSGNYTEWPHSYGYEDPYLNGTRFDDLFGWGEKWGPSRYPPVFPKLPQDYNTLLNDTIGVPWGRRTIYILGKGGPVDATGVSTTQDGIGTNYALCQMQAGLTDSCSTHYNASNSGSSMEAVCEEDSDPLQYAKNRPEGMPLRNDTLNADWPSIASTWAKSLSLSSGVVDGRSSNARILTQMIITSENFSSALPSMAEALAVMSGDTLIQSITDAPFVGHKWNYTIPVIQPGAHQTFNVSMRTRQFTSGGTVAYQKAFFVVLALVFAMNVVMLGYFLKNKDWYFDVLEPMNLFSLAVNSPPSEKLAGSCGCGPSGEQYRVSWKLNTEGDHYFVESPDPVVAGVVDGRSPKVVGRRRFPQSFESDGPSVKLVIL